MPGLLGDSGELRGCAQALGTDAGHRAQPDATICGMHAHDIRPAPPAAHQIELQEPEPDQVRAARKCAGHTQTQAGQLVGGTLRTWQDWESGKRAMPAAALALYLLLTDQHPDMRLTRKKWELYT